jgi:peptidoglycan/xylan/chitin deacetylase (PgdA/CDA1 family)
LAVAAVDHAVPSGRVAARPLPSAHALPSSTAQDDVGTFVDPTPTPKAAAAAVAAGARGPGGPHIVLPILLYHYIRVNPVATDQVGWNLSVTPAHFAQQMAFLRFIGAHTLTLTDALDALRTGTALPPRSVILTFDDGYTNFATRATPVMVQDGLVGTVFVVSGFIGRNGYMTAAQVQQVAAEGMVIGCHTVSHVALASVPLSFAQQQIDVAHSQLEALLGTRITDFAYPYGSYDAAVEKLVQADGFSDAVTTDSGATLYLSQPYAWPRYRVGGSDTVESFAHKALFGMPLNTINQLLARFLASPAASGATPSPSPTPSHAATAQVAATDSRRYS